MSFLVSHFLSSPLTFCGLSFSSYLHVSFCSSVYLSISSFFLYFTIFSPFLFPSFTHTLPPHPLSLYSIYVALSLFLYCSLSACIFAALPCSVSKRQCHICIYPPMFVETSTLINHYCLAEGRAALLLHLSLHLLSPFLPFRSSFFSAAVLTSWTLKRGAERNLLPAFQIRFHSLPLLLLCLCFHAVRLLSWFLQTSWNQATHVRFVCPREVFCTQ